MPTVQSFKDMDVWNVAMDLAVLAYGLTELLPNSERFGLVVQIRRAACSIPANIAEGHSTGKDGTYLRHVRIALGSAGELFTHFEIARRLGFLSNAELVPLLEQLRREIQLLHGLRRALRLRLAKAAGCWLALLGLPAIGHAFLTILG